MSQLWRPARFLIQDTSNLPRTVTYDRLQQYIFISQAIKMLSWKSPLFLSLTTIGNQPGHGMSTSLLCGPSRRVVTTLAYDCLDWPTTATSSRWLGDTLLSNCDDAFSMSSGLVFKLCDAVEDTVGALSTTPFLPPMLTIATTANNVRSVYDPFVWWAQTYELCSLSLNFDDDKPDL